MKQCPQCGVELPDDARFCMQFGTPQEQAPDAQAHVEGTGAATQGGAAVGGNVGGKPGAQAESPKTQPRAIFGHGVTLAKLQLIRQWHIRLRKSRELKVR